MITLTLDGSGNGTETITTVPGARYRVRWVYTSPTPSAGTLTVKQWDGSLSSTTTTARDELGTELTHDLTAVASYEATIIAAFSSVAINVAGADADDSVSLSLQPIT